MPPTDAEVPQPVSAAKPNPRNNPTMFKIFQNVQYNVVQHKKYVKEMIKLYKKLDEDSFRESFRNALQYLFTFGDTSANVDRVVQFVATFCTSLDDEEEFLLFIFNIIFDCQCVSGQSVRYRASQLLAAVLSALGDDASLDDDLCDKLLASQMQRLQDTRGAVRCRAALALQRLQNPMEPDDEVTRAYRFHMSCDPSSSVRRAIVMSIAKCSRNVPFVLERLCDVDEAVRRAAFLYIAAINVTQLRVRQRVLTLKVGLTERSVRVRRVVEEILIPGWLSTFQGNIVDLLKAIRLDNAHDAKDSQYVAGKLLESLFKRLPISELLEWLPTDKNLRLIPAEKLNKETAWYWRHLAEHLQKIDDDDTLESILPDLVVLTGYIRAIVESPCPVETDDPVGFSTRQYVLHELATMLRVYDATDPTGRGELQTLITDVLTGDYGPLNADVIRAFVNALELVLPEISARMEVINGVIGALRDPPEPEQPCLPPPVVDCTEAKLQRARLRVSLNVAIEAQEEAVREQNYSLAAECKAKVADIQKKLDELSIQPAPAPAPVPISTIKEKLSDTATLTKCLTILNSALDTPQVKSITPMMQMIFNELEVDIFQNPEIVETALETVALYGMLDKEFAKENKAFFFANLIDTSNERTVSTVLRCIVDLLCVHGARVFEDDAQEDTTVNTTKKRSTYHTSVIDDDGNISESAISMSPAHSTVIELLLKIMDSTCSAYRLIIVEGLCRLLHLGHLESPAILSRLLLLWFNPATVDEDMLRQTIGVFFQTFPTTVDGAQEQIQKATLPTLRALANAPSSSPLAEIDQEAVVRFIVSLTRVNHELADSQGGMATVLCNYMVRRASAPEVGLACRLLALLSVPRDALLASELAHMLRDLCLKLPDKQSCRNLTRYLGALEATERASMNKMSNTGITEGVTMQEDSLAPLGRTTSSLPQPIARSTHVVINETVEEEVEIDETSPTDAISRISEAPPQAESSRAVQESTTTLRESSGTDTEPMETADKQSESSSDESPVKRAKITKSKKKKLSLNRPASSSDSSKPPKEKAAKAKKDAKEKETSDPDNKGVKRSRSQRSLVDVERAKAKAEEKAKTEEKLKTEEPAKTEQKTKQNQTKSKKKQSPKATMSSQESSSPVSDLDVSNVTVRKSTRGLQSGSSTESNGSTKGKGKSKKQPEMEPPAVSKPVRRTRSSTGSRRSSAGSSRSMHDDSDDTLHTIVYEKEFVQSILNDSSELADSRRSSRANVTIPETPDASEESESEPETKKKGKNKRNAKKK
ncbi:condensin complex subunit 3 isoform X1 [Spodoptera frugiperda]|uniref:Condensin complex subunit 3 isoform X1 n=2 Tax=Spodoptera frugiperda TaxID=7108 RepID=A0A9R0DT66_SPOFR|nr:condensin complex subunit 3 isoform X1 [Spodoptera frugiperda]